MAIVICCLACDTVFRVTPSQLQAHGGSVRCGRCLTVFDGFKTLFTEPELAAAEAEELPPSDSAADLTVPEVVSSPRASDGSPAGAESSATADHEGVERTVP